VLAARVVVTGSIASTTSLLALVAACRARGRSASAGPNAISHWIWGMPAWHTPRGDIRHTAVGSAIHHGSSLLWATVYEGWAWRRPTRQARVQLARAVAVTTLAAVVDYAVVPKRLSPGFEAWLRPREIALVYLAFAGGLAASALLRDAAANRKLGPSRLHRG
jgi:hypothetical protein